MRQTIFSIFAMLILMGCMSEEQSRIFDTKLNVHAYCRQVIESQLKDPSSAQFPTENFLQVVKLTSGDTYKYSSYVVARNGLGGSVRTNFECLCRGDRDAVSLIKLTVDDQ